ncbi:MAG: rod shape-determining protein MreC [Christensenellales bacterium]|jgi:rod shape-determining protein MreC
MLAFLQHKVTWLAMALVLVIIAAIVFSAAWRGRTGEPSFIEKGISSALQWVQRGAASAAEEVTGWVRGPYWDGKTHEDYLKLQQEVSALRQQNADMQELQRENQRLRELLDSAEALSDSEPVHAKVINRSANPFGYVFIIDKGEKDGIAKDMAVIDSGGLVGKVVDAGSNWARVMSIIDTNCSVPAIVERTRDPGIVRGNMTALDEDALLNMIYLPAESELSPGDRIVTSGMGGIYPKGIIIGEVMAVGRDASSQHGVSIRPAADFVHLEDVLVLTDVVETVPIQ